MITYRGDDGDNVFIFNEGKFIIVRPSGTTCWVDGCGRDIDYGYNFCKDHQWILPISAEECRFGFQVALIKYWKEEMKEKVIFSHTYQGQVLSLGFRIS